jgi:hypothetical protein
MSAQKVTSLPKKSEFRLVLIEWLDSYGCSSTWQDLANCEPGVRQAITIVIGLTLDLLHYVAGSLAWAIFNGVKERAGTHEDTEFLAPRPINWPALVLFWSKTIIMVVAYGFILRFLYHRLV